MHIVIDIETKSGESIKDVGLHKYIEDEEFRILLIGYMCLDNKGNEIERGVIDWFNRESDTYADLSSLFDNMGKEDTVLHAFNVDFEHTALVKTFPFLEKELARSKWHDIQVDAMQLGLPSGLDKVASVLGVGRKMLSGKEGIKLFSVPRGAGYDIPYYALSKELQLSWDNFKDYCMRDVELEASILKMLNPTFKLNVTDAERAIELMSSKINNVGVRVDVKFAEWLRELHLQSVENSMEELKDITGLANPNSNVQFSAWLRMHGCAVNAVDKETLKVLKADSSTSELVIRAIETRLDMSSTIPKKYAAAVNIRLANNRLHGLFKYYGANRTGRWTSTGYQLHNLARTDSEISDKLRFLYTSGYTPAEAMPLVKDESIEQRKPMGVIIGQCVRSIIVPNEGRKFVIADYSAIEARVAAWIADEEWVLDVFRTDGMVYERTAARMFGVPIEEVTHGSVMRRKGKYAVLALGYGGGVNALERFGAGVDMTPEEMDGLVVAWREANSNIVRMWKDLELGFRRALAAPGTKVRVNDKLYYFFDTKLSVMKLFLPSGRFLAYYEPTYSGRTISYRSSTLGASGVRDTTYGGKLMENVCQAVARDVLGDLLVRLDSLAFPASVIMHVHDEVVAEALEDYAQEAMDIMCKLGRVAPTWAAGLPLEVEASISHEYTK